jgi:predicted PurR-regulated permease PerM
MPDGVGSAQRDASDWRQVILFAFAVAASIALVLLTARVLLVLFAGLLFALVLHALAAAAERKTHVPYKVALASSVLLLVGAASCTFFFALPAIGSQVRELGKSLPEGVARVSETLHLSALGLTGGLKPPDLAGNIEKFTAHTLAALGTSLEVFGGLVVLFFVGVYGAVEPESYAKVLLWFVPPTKKRLVRRIMTVSTGNLERWLLGRLVAMLFVGVTSGIAFLVLHVPLAFPLALLAGLLTFVEYIGAFASAAPPILLALSESPTRALWVAVVFAVLHVVEGYVLTPLLAKTAVRFPPATTLASQAVLSALLGPLGLTFATPLMVVVVTAAQEWRKSA